MGGFSTSEWKCKCKRVTGNRFYMPNPRDSSKHAPGFVAEKMGPGHRTGLNAIRRMGNAGTLEEDSVKMTGLLPLSDCMH